MHTLRQYSTIQYSADTHSRLQPASGDGPASRHSAHDSQEYYSTLMLALSVSLCVAHTLSVSLSSFLSLSHLAPCVYPSLQDPRAALRVALDPNAIKPIDVAAVNGQYFVNIAVAGSIAGVSPDELSSSWKRLLGPVAIGVHGEQSNYKLGFQQQTAKSVCVLEACFHCWCMLVAELSLCGMFSVTPLAVLCIGCLGKLG